MRGTYEGPAIVNNPDAPMIDAGRVDGAKTDMVYYGNYFNDGNHSWLLQACSSSVSIENGLYAGDGYVLTTQIAADPLGSGEYLPDGTYAISDVLNRYPTALKGVVDGGNYKGTWLRQLKGGSIFLAHPATTGTLTITRSGNTYTMTLDAVNAGGLTVKGTFTGTANIMYPESAAAKARLPREYYGF
jgi:hypothetical protein